MKRAFVLVILCMLASPVAAQDKVQPNTTTLGAARGHSTLVITFNAPGDACTNNQVAEYDLRISTSTITECNFTSATSVSGTPNPASPGSSHCVAVASLSCNTTYYIAFKSKDSAGNWSDISTHSVTTRACNDYLEVECE